MEEINYIIKVKSEKKLSEKEIANLMLLLHSRMEGYHVEPEEFPKDLIMTISYLKT